MRTIDATERAGHRRREWSRQDQFTWRTALVDAGAALSWLGERLERRRSRSALEEMSDAQLKDIGISRADAFREAHRPFWD